MLKMYVGLQRSICYKNKKRCKIKIIRINAKMPEYNKSRIMDAGVNYNVFPFPLQRNPPSEGYIDPREPRHRRRRVTVSP